MKKITNILNHSIINLPSPVNISYWWNFDSLLGIFILIQIIRGLFLSIHYCPNISFAFKRIIRIIQNVPNGWIIHNIHGASFFFISIYIHIDRNIYYNSFNLTYTWISGVTIFLLSIATAFLGYVLPWGQISFWGATVITNLILTISYIGNTWVWGGFSINNSTLNRFFSFHFILPFIILIFIILHLFFLHLTGSSNPTGLNRNLYKIPFHPYFTFKDLLGFNLILSIFLIIILQYPYIFSDPNNFIPANPLVTPTSNQNDTFFLLMLSFDQSLTS